MGDTEFLRKTKGFNPTLSFDGVAIIIACILSSLWFGRLENRISVAEKTLDHQAQIIANLSDSQANLSKVVAVLQRQMDDYMKGKQ